MATRNEDCQTACCKHLNRFFACHHHEAMRLCAMKVLEALAADEEPMRGKPEGWAAGIIYAVANYERYACGVPGLFNAEFEEFFGVTMNTVYRRAAQVGRVMDA